MYIVSLIHKAVREIPGSQTLNEQNSKMGLVVTIIMTIILVTCIILVLLNRKIGLYLGFIPAIWATIQWILVHVIFAYEDINGIWWYPIFPTIQGLLIIYFSIIALKNDSNLI